MVVSTPAGASGWPSKQLCWLKGVGSGACSLMRAGTAGVDLRGSPWDRVALLRLRRHGFKALKASGSLVWALGEFGLARAGNRPGPLIAAAPGCSSETRKPAVAGPPIRTDSAVPTDHTAQRESLLGMALRVPPAMNSPSNTPATAAYCREPFTVDRVEANSPWHPVSRTLPHKAYRSTPTEVLAE